jgi:tight adherence protein B
MELTKKRYYQQAFMFYLLNQWIFMFPFVLIAVFFISILFFNSISITILSSLSSIVFIKPLKKLQNQKLLKRRENEFMFFIYSLSSLISIGKSFESAFSISVEEMNNEGSVYILLLDLEEIRTCFEMNMSITDGLSMLTAKYPIETILNFSKIVEIAIIQGGSIEAIIEATVSMIREKNDVENELEVIITQKKFELIILLSFVPFMILYLRVVTSNFSQLMYESFSGKSIMFVCLLLYLASGYIGRKIVNIKV